jgi:hypothetical protein
MTPTAPTADAIMEVTPAADAIMTAPPPRTCGAIMNFAPPEPPDPKRQ